MEPARETGPPTPSESDRFKLVADDGDSEDFFGYRVAVSGDGSTALVGASGDEDPHWENAGAAYVFTRSGGSWSQQAKLVPDDGDGFDLFGESVSVSGDGSTALVGAPLDEGPNGADAGSAYVFTTGGGSWSQQAKLVPDDGDDFDQFGRSVAISDDGSTALVGAQGDEDHNGKQAGAAYVVTNRGGSWSQHAKLAPGDRDDGSFFGGSVAVSGDGSTALVGTPFDHEPNGGDGGSAYVFTTSGGSWSQQAKLTANDGDIQDRFGYSVTTSADGSTALVGAYLDEDHNGATAGAAYVFTRSGGSWSQRAKLTADDGDIEDKFGESVAVSGDGSTALVGAPFDDEPNGSDAGSAYVFTTTGDSWSQQAKLAAADGDSHDFFGDSVGTSDDGSTALVGAWFDEDPNGDAAGSAYVFDGY